ncbi:hypothetical protein [Edaphobacter albus]|uniref:hypothetical protein n=1 Tax=Edaphobacter sp. 4G125 TaxID=2763071 RepID=UPI001645F15F|nr:hypothetical protein [Edaphobacter sp. 4G125]QNI36016.1 hypothetical protein H7846_13545 [Edaphobacter sp. 4G125]
MLELFGPDAFLGEADLLLVEFFFAFAEIVLLLGEDLSFAVDVVPHLLAGFEGFGRRGEESVVGVGDDLFEGLLGERLGVRGEFLVRREIGAGDLESVEEEAGAARVDVIGGEALEDEADGELDGGAVFGDGEVDGGAAGFAGVRIRDGSAGGVVVVAEVLVAE